MTLAGLEPAIPGSVGRCLIHWATGQSAGGLKPPRAGCWALEAHHWRDLKFDPGRLCPRSPPPNARAPRARAKLYVEHLLRPTRSVPRLCATAGPRNQTVRPLRYISSRSGHRDLIRAPARRSEDRAAEHAAAGAYYFNDALCDRKRARMRSMPRRPPREQQPKLCLHGTLPTASLA